MDARDHELRERKVQKEPEQVVDSDMSKDEEKSKKTFGRTPEGRGMITESQMPTMN